MLMEEFKSPSELEKQYLELFPKLEKQVLKSKGDNSSLEQPPAYDNTETITTYGFYDQPLLPR